MVDVVRVSGDVIEIEPIVQTVSAPTIGAVATFSGVTRDNFNSKKVTRLEYEAYVPMAERVLQQIVAEIKARWKVHAVGIVHRTGKVDVGECSVIVVVSSAHRQAALAGCAFGIDAVKAYCPIWKRECYEDGSVWKENEAERQVLKSGLELSAFQRT
eukprot:c8056_g1_i1.p2 GENE.c8056_g1_i1~~c8056_g1_i1.p2  ORF type:complete len:157 (+),score=44.01 c8056_g1_i1:679-1149(+)